MVGIAMIISTLVVVLIVAVVFSKLREIDAVNKLLISSSQFAGSYIKSVEYNLKNYISNGFYRIPTSKYVLDEINRWKTASNNTTILMSNISTISPTNDLRMIYREALIKYIESLEDESLQWSVGYINNRQEISNLIGDGYTVYVTFGSGDIIPDTGNSVSISNSSLDSVIRYSSGIAIRNTRKENNELMEVLLPEVSVRLYSQLVLVTDGEGHYKWVFKNKIPHGWSVVDSGLLFDVTTSVYMQLPHSYDYLLEYMLYHFANDYERVQALANEKSYLIVPYPVTNYYVGQRVSHYFDPVTMHILNDTEEYKNFTVGVSEAIDVQGLSGNSVRDDTVGLMPTISSGTVSTTAFYSNDVIATLLLAPTKKNNFTNYDVLNPYAFFTTLMQFNSYHVDNAFKYLNGYYLRNSPDYLTTDFGSGVFDYFDYQIDQLYLYPVSQPVAWRMSGLIDNLSTVYSDLNINPFFDSIWSASTLYYGDESPSFLSDYDSGRKRVTLNSIWFENLFRALQRSSYNYPYRTVPYIGDISSLVGLMSKSGDSARGSFTPSQIGIDGYLSTGFSYNDPQGQVFEDIYSGLMLSMDSLPNVVDDVKVMVNKELDAENTLVKTSLNDEPYETKPVMYIVKTGNSREGLFLEYLWRSGTFWNDNKVGNLMGLQVYNEDSINDNIEVPTMLVEQNGLYVTRTAPFSTFINSSEPTFTGKCKCSVSSPVFEDVKYKVRDTQLYYKVNYVDQGYESLSEKYSISGSTDDVDVYEKDYKYIYDYSDNTYSAGKFTVIFSGGSWTVSPSSHIKETVTGSNNTTTTYDYYFSGWISDTAGCGDSSATFSYTIDVYVNGSYSSTRSGSFSLDTYNTGIVCSILYAINWSSDNVHSVSMSGSINVGKRLVSYVVGYMETVPVQVDVTYTQDGLSDGYADRVVITINGVTKRLNNVELDKYYLLKFDNAFSKAGDYVLFKLSFYVSDPPGWDDPDAQLTFVADFVKYFAVIPELYEINAILEQTYDFLISGYYLGFDTKLLEINPLTNPYIGGSIKSVFIPEFTANEYIKTGNPSSNAIFPTGSLNTIEKTQFYLSNPIENIWVMYFKYNFGNIVDISDLVDYTTFQSDYSYIFPEYFVKTGTVAIFPFRYSVNGVKVSIVYSFTFGFPTSDFYSDGSIDPSTVQMSSSIFSPSYYSVGIDITYKAFRKYTSGNKISGSEINALDVIADSIASDYYNTLKNKVIQYDVPVFITGDGNGGVTFTPYYDLSKKFAPVYLEASISS